MKRRKIEPAKITQNWDEGYKFRKANGKLTNWGHYETVFDLGNGEYAMSPYYGNIRQDSWMVVDAATVLKTLTRR